MSKKSVTFLMSIIEFINCCFNFRERIILATIFIILTPINFPLKMIFIISFNIFNIFVDWGYWKLKDIKFKLRKNDLFEILYKWFEIRDDIEIIEIIDLIDLIMENDYNYNYYWLIVEFKQYKEMAKEYKRINLLLKEVNNLNFLDKNEFYHVYKLKKYIDKDFKDEKYLYLETNIEILVKFLKDKNRKINEINTIKQDNKKNNIYSIILSIILTILTSNVGIELFHFFIN